MPSTLLPPLHQPASLLACRHACAAVENQSPDVCLEPLKRLSLVHGLLAAARIKLQELDDGSDEVLELREDCR